MFSKSMVAACFNKKNVSTAVLTRMKGKDVETKDFKSKKISVSF